MKTVLVTGANRGLGLEFCQQYLKLGYNVLACSRQPERARILAKLSHANKQLQVHSLDVVSESSIHMLVAELTGEGVQIDLLINNAGVCIEEPFGHWSADKLLKQFAVNSVGPAMVTNAMFHLLNENAKVIFISSGLGSISDNINPDGPYDGYSMSKAALSVLCRRLAAKDIGKSLQFACLNPGWAKTEMGGVEAPSEPDESVKAMIEVIDALEPKDSGNFFDSEGRHISW